MNQEATMAEPEKTTQKPSESNSTQPTPVIDTKYPWKSYAVEKIRIFGDQEKQISPQTALNFYFEAGRISIFKKFVKNVAWGFAIYKKVDNEYVLIDQLNLEEKLALISTKKKDKIKTMINTANFSVKKNAAIIIAEMTVLMVEHIEQIDIEMPVEELEENKLPVFDKIENPSWFNTLRLMRTGMYIEDPVPYTIGLTTFISNKIEDDEPIWMMQIGVPGIGKTVFTKNLIPDNMYSNAWVIQLSEMTSKSFVTGKEDTEDLLPIILNKLLLFSDFTVMLSGKTEEVIAIFNQLRELYDGKYSKAFGSGVGVKHYSGTFSVLANVTNIYDVYKNQLSAVGDRFASVRFKPSSHEFSKKITESAYNNTKIDPEILKAISNEMLTLYDNFDPNKLAPIGDEWAKYIQQCAMITATLRIPVKRDTFKKGHPIIVKPAKEEATRLVKVYKKLGHVLCYVLEKPEFDLEVLSYIYRVALDTAEELRVNTLSNVTAMACGIEKIEERMNLKGVVIPDVLVDLKYAGLVWMDDEVLDLSNMEGNGTEPMKGEMMYSLNGAHSPILHYIKDIETKLNELPPEKTHHNLIGIGVLHNLE